jgi:hypothetical protein
MTPHLINLDEKVLLHELLTGNMDSADARAFWPKGYTNDEKKE